MCSNFPELIDIILQKQQRHKNSVIIKISIHGGGFLKLCLSIFDINDSCSRSNSALSKKFLESSVKRVFIIGLVPNVSEHYMNIKWIWINHGINILKNHTMATDLKLCNVLLRMIIVCIWVSTTPKITTPSFLSSPPPPLNLQTVQAPLFRQFPLYIDFSLPLPPSHLKIRFFSKP